MPCEWADADRVGIGAGILVYVHGGGFVYENPVAERTMIHRLSRAARRPALRVGYRLSPEHPFPAAADDLIAVHRALLDQGVPPERIVWAGESAGATIILSALLMLGPAGIRPPAGAVPVSPPTDFTPKGESLDGNDGKDLLSREVMDHVVPQYLAGAAPDEAPQSPIHGDLRGLPPLLVVAGGDELFLDDARRFAEAARQQGVRADLDIYDGMPHTFHATALIDDPLPVGTTFLERLTRWIDGLDITTETVPVADAGTGPYGIAAGPGGSLWSTMVHSGAVACLDADRALAVHALRSQETGPTVITHGPDGALWFTEYKCHRIGRMTTDGQATSFPASTEEAGPYGIAPGPDGALWFTEMNTDRIGRMATDGTATDTTATWFPIPVAGGFPSFIAAGPDGAMWFTLNHADSIGRITMDGDVTVHPVPTTGAAPVGIAAGWDGAMWFVEIGTGAIGRIAMDGTVSEFPLGDPDARPHAITAGPGGDCWFTEWGAGRVGRISPSGRIREYDLPPGASEPHGIAAGPDGAVWTAMESGALVRIRLADGSGEAGGQRLRAAASDQS